MCVLSLKRLYDPMERRVEAFRLRRESITSLPDLVGLIEEYPSPLDFATEELNHRDQNKAQTILGVTKHLIVAQSDHKQPCITLSALVFRYQNSVAVQPQPTATCLLSSV
jgi:hypothetical protein